MRKKQPLLSKSTERDDCVQASDLARHAESWLLVGDINQHSQRTIGSRREVISKFRWFLDHRKIETCGTHEIRLFLQYLTHGHEEPGGRWQNPRMTSGVSSGTVKTYHSILRTFFAWLATEGEITSSPMERITAPSDRPDQIQPFSSDQLNALLKAAKRSVHPRRDEAILLFLLDTGVRASELCSIKCRDVDLQAGNATVLGKGNKTRTVPFSRDTKRAVYNYLNERDYDPHEALFISDRGHTAGDGLSRHGLRMLINRFGKAAGLDAVRTSPHTFRHTFAIEFLRAGGNVFTLQQMLGHTHLAMTNRYVAVAQADIVNQHRHYSPVSRLKGGR